MRSVEEASDRKGAGSEPRDW